MYSLAFTVLVLCTDDKLKRFISLPVRIVPLNIVSLEKSIGTKTVYGKKERNDF